MYTRLILLLSFFLIVTIGGQAQFILSQAQKRLLDSIAIQDVPAGAPGIATAIISKGKLIYEKVAGFADLADSTLITRETRFNIASNGKQFTALALLTLIDARRLKLTDDIRVFFPKLYPFIKDRISISHLLTHTSGIRDCYDLWSLQGYTWWKKSFNNNDVLSLVEKQQDLNFVPGSKYLYSNTNYILLAMIIEKVSGKTFVDYTNDMFRLLEMPNTSFENDYKNIRGPIARAYFNFGTWTTYDWVWNVVGDGNIFSTLADQVQWEKLIQGTGTTAFKKALIVESQQLIKNAKTSTYGYGLEFGTYKGLRNAFHEGASGAWKATVIRFPRNKISMVTLTNTGKATPNTQTRQMADVVFDLNRTATGFATKPIKAGTFISDDDVIGLYQTGNNFTFLFEKREGHLYLKRNGRNDIELVREANNIFHQVNDAAFKQEFKRNKQGEMEITAYYISHAPYTLTRTNNDWTDFNYTALDGKFQNTETGVVIDIRFFKDRIYHLNFSCKDSATGLLVSPTKLLVNNYVLETESVPKVPRTLLLGADRIARVKFSRIE